MQAIANPWTSVRFRYAPPSPLSQSLENLEPISLATWLENSPIDLVDDLPVEAGEVGLKKLALRRLAVDIIHRAQ